MTSPKIENSDRGITLNKSLAWTIAAALIGGGIWVGIEVNAARSGIEVLTQRQTEDRIAFRRRQDEDREQIRANTGQIATMLSQNARADARLEAIENSQRRIEETLAAIERHLRTLRP